MPGEEGYPAVSRQPSCAVLRESRPMWIVLGEAKAETGAVTVIGAVSPPGGDISEPVSQATLRIVKVFWGLDPLNLAYKRHFPAINWLTSYSLYLDLLAPWFDKNVSRRLDEAPSAYDDRFCRKRRSLQEIVKLGRHGRSVGFKGQAQNGNVHAQSERTFCISLRSMRWIPTQVPGKAATACWKLILEPATTSATAGAGRRTQAFAKTHRLCRLWRGYRPYVNMPRKM